MPHIIEDRHELTSRQIRDLRAAAEQAGDAARVALCDLALTGEPRARREIAEYMRQVEAAFGPRR